MRASFLILIFLLILISADAAHLVVDARYATSGVVTNRRVLLKLDQPGAVVAGPWLIAGDYVVQYTGTNGQTTFSNVLAGGYSITIYGSPTRSFALGVPDTNGVISAASLIGNTNVTPVYYTAPQVDALIAAGGGGGGGALLAANNLDDVADAATARDNLGLEIGADVLAPNGSGAALTGITQSQVTGLEAEASSHTKTNESRAVSLSNPANVFYGDGSNLTGIAGGNGNFNTNNSGTNITFFTGDNNPNATGAALLVKPLEKNTIPGLAAKYIEIEPPYTNDNFRAVWRQTVAVVTNTLGDLLPDITWTRGYNYAGNAAGVSSYGNTDTNEAAWNEQVESRWQNLAGQSILEWWYGWKTPYTEWGTNFSWRPFGFDLKWATTNKTYQSSIGQFTVDSLELRAPTGDGTYGVKFEQATANSTSMNQTTKGTLTTLTNDQGLGGVVVKGGLVTVGAPDSVSANNMILRVDWNNGTGNKPHAMIYATGSPKTLFIGRPDDASSNWTNIQAGTNFVVRGDLNASNATVAGTVIAGTFSGSGASLTALDGSQISSGTVPNERLDADLADLADGSLTGSKVGTGINADNITTGTITGTGGLVRNTSPTLSGDIAIDPDGSASWTINREVDALRLADSVSGSIYTFGNDGILIAPTVAVDDEAYGAGWNASVEVPTKNAVYDKLETLIGDPFWATNTVPAAGSSVKTTNNVTVGGALHFQSDGESGWFIVTNITDLVLTNSVNNASFIFKSNGTFVANSVDISGLNINGTLNTGTLNVTTNLSLPAGQLGVGSAITNYWVNMQSTNIQWIVATGHVYLVDFTNSIAGSSKMLCVTNPFWGTSNINVFAPTNMMWIGSTNGRGIASSPMHTNFFFPVGFSTNFVVFSYQALGTARQSIITAASHATMIP
jgi:hypothetical protein